jgi:hypothetical protein
MHLPASPEPTDWLRYEWALLHTGIALADWTHTTAADGRPVHESRLDTAPVTDPEALVTRFAQVPLPQGYEGAQQRQYLDLSDPGRVAAVWLLNGEWLVVSAPRTPVVAVEAGEPVAGAEKPAQRITPATVARTAAKRRIPRPSGRLPFGRRPKTPKETTS